MKALPDKDSEAYDSLSHSRLQSLEEVGRLEHLNNDLPRSQSLHHDRNFDCRLRFWVGVKWL